MAISSTTTIDFSCEEKDRKFGGLGNFTCCDVIEDLKIHEENVTITKPDEAIMYGFVAENMEIYYLPQGIEKIFPILKVLIILNCKLRKITTENLEKLTHLKVLDLSWNEIEFLEPKLFQFNNDLRAIFMSNNKIKIIDSSTFRNMPNLVKLDLQHNICVSLLATEQWEMIIVENITKISCSWEYNRMKDDYIKRKEMIRNLENKNKKLTALNKHLDSKNEEKRNFFYNLMSTLIAVTLILHSFYLIIFYNFYPRVHHEDDEYISMNVLNEPEYWEIGS